MEVVAFINDSFFNFLLLGLIFFGICWTFAVAKSHPSSTPVLNGQHKPFACLLEDIPKHYLKGQFYPLATPLLTPLTCLLEDAPSTALKGQFYPLATPLMTPLTCLLEDVPSTALKGQFYPFATPLACVWELGWFSFYRQQMGKPGINYWQWQNDPLIHQFSPELSDLLSLKEPHSLVKGVLESLGEEYHSFWTWDNLCAFKQWHQETSKSLGLTRLQAIYSFCYKMSWNTLEFLLVDNKITLDPILLDEASPWWKVLGITTFSPPTKAEKAYKNLLRLWHPDRTLHPLAHQITARINTAYEEYQLRQEKKAQRMNSLQNFFKK
ncbi:J domain-containing protein [Crocosphaera sp. UHCC 0190]|uniref:J domain-containing protein n=1 Tax=Crocosphaera sp. UHCC 0190 TaxID=3110246 RepID=UPI002B212157|nr:J domain-containing protein [Crocosphaera sp. UHCC 0190]MEA5509825.1 J domain-containing protein [Crocosphaera sp. UHCC 0190]